MREILQTLNREWGVSIARNFHPDYPREWPIVLVHSPGMAYAFDSHNTGLDSPEAAMSMLNVLGLHELADPFDDIPYSEHWDVLLDRHPDSDDARPSELRGPYPVAPIGPLVRGHGHVEEFWRAPAREHGGLCQLMFVWGVDFASLDGVEIPEALVSAAADHRMAGATIRVSE